MIFHLLLVVQQKRARSRCFRIRILYHSEIRQVCVNVAFV